MSGIDTLANTLFTSLITGETIPKLSAPDFTQPAWTPPGLTGPAPTPLTNAALTSGTVGGTGVFDLLMQAVSAQLMVEFQAGRIQGAQYSSAYVAAIQAVLPAAVQFLLGRDQAYWQAELAQQQAIAAQAEAFKALIDIEVAKAQYAIAIFQGYTAEAEFTLTKAKLSTESIAYDTANYQLTTMLPAQLANVQAQTALTNEQTSVQTYTLGTMMPMQLNLVTEQVNSQKAQTSNTRFSDAATVTGLIGSQVALYTQQCTSYRRNAEVNAAKLFTDAFNTQVTVNSSTTPPTHFTDATLDQVLASIQNNNNLTGVTTP